MLLYGGIAAAALLIVVAIALSQSGTDEVARGPADAPLIKAEDQPFKVSPVNPGGMEVPNRDILLYERLHGTKADKRVVERLMPEAEQPQTPPAAPRPTQMAENSERIRSQLFVRAGRARYRIADRAASAGTSGQANGGDY